MDDLVCSCILSNYCSESNNIVFNIYVIALKINVVEMKDIKT